MVGGGKGAKAQGTETTPTKLELNPAVGPSQQGNNVMAGKKKPKGNKKKK